MPVQWRKADQPQHPAVQYLSWMNSFSDEFDEDFMCRVIAGYCGLISVVDAHVGSDGVVQRLVMRNADPSNPAVPDPDGDGYAMDFDFDPGIAVTAPPASEISEIPAAELPTTPAAIPCQLEP